MLRLEGTHIVAEHIALTENAGIFGVHTEDEADAEDIQASQYFLLIRWWVILSPENIVNLTDQLTGFDGNLKLFFDVLVLLLDEEVETIKFLFQVFQQHFFRLAVGLLHVVNEELGKVAGDNPAGPAWVRKLGGVSLGLLKWCQGAAVGLLDRFAEVFAKALLLYHYFGSRDKSVDEASVVKGYLVLKGYVFGRVLNTKDFKQQG